MSTFLWVPSDQPSQTLDQHPELELARSGKNLPRTQSFTSRHSVRLGVGCKVA